MLLLMKSLELSKQGRPVLIGTTSVEISELLSRMLSIRKVHTSTLNAKMHKSEADIVAQAGNPGWLQLQPTWQVVVQILN